jgi:hypothetical protein
MSILEIGNKGISVLSRTTLAAEGIHERRDLQRVLLEGLHVIAPDVMVITQEFGGWEDSRRRIDILGLDKDARLVVVELKRTEDGGHMELQALRYAAMASVMTFDHVVEVHRVFLESRGDGGDARDRILEFLTLEDPDEDSFAQEVRIILVSMEFSKEITTTVLWLNERGLDIRCVRLTPYNLAGRVLLDVQQIIPLPEAAEFQTRVREKQRKESESRRYRDLTRYELTLGNTVINDLPKRHAIHQLFKFLVGDGIGPEKIVESMGFRQNRTILRFEPGTSAEEIRGYLTEQLAAGKSPLHPRRWFCDDEEILEFDGAKYIVSNQWGRGTERALRNITSAFRDRVSFRAMGADESSNRHLSGADR